VRNTVTSACDRTAAATLSTDSYLLLGDNIAPSHLQHVENLLLQPVGNLLLPCSHPTGKV
jgi:hypothetical protein